MVHSLSGTQSPTSVPQKYRPQHFWRQVSWTAMLFGMSFFAGLWRRPSKAASAFRVQIEPWNVGKLWRTWSCTKLHRSLFKQVCPVSLILQIIAMRLPAQHFFPPHPPEPSHRHHHQTWSSRPSTSWPYRLNCASGYTTTTATAVAHAQILARPRYAPFPSRSERSTRRKSCG